MTTWAHPYCLYGVLLLVPLGLLGWYRWRLEAAVRQTFAAAPALGKMGMLPAGWLPVVRTVLLMVAWASVLAGLARPQGEPILTADEHYGSDIVLAVDVSESMRALDGTPGERLNAARTIINNLLRELPGDRVGLVAFAGTAVSLCPLTDDYAVVGSFVDELEVNAGVEPGSNLTAAIMTALRRYPPEAKGGRLIVLFSDGEDLSGQVDMAVELASQRGIPVAAVGLGSSRGAPIPVGEDLWGNYVYKAYEGQQVITRLDESALRRLARQSGGQYWRGDNPWRTSQRLLTFVRSLGKQALRSTTVQQYDEYFPWCLGGAAALLLLELALTLGRYRLALPGGRERRSRRAVRVRAAMAGLLILAAWGQVAWTWPWETYRANRQGVEAFGRRNYVQAQQAFRRAADASGHFVPWHNLGNAYYKQKRYREAQNAYQKALQLAPAEARSRMHFNLGNTYYRMAEGRARPRMLGKALEAYTRALQLNPGDEDAQANAEFVRRLLRKKPPPRGSGPSPAPPQALIPPSPGSPASGPGSPMPSTSPPPGGSPAPASPSPGDDGQSSTAPGPPATPDEMRQVEDFLRQMERMERLSQNYFRHRRGTARQPGRSLTDMPIEDLMNMSPEELAELLKQQFNTGPERSSGHGGKDW